MSGHSCTYCAARTAVAAAEQQTAPAEHIPHPAAPVVHPPVELPAAPRRFRVHLTERHPLDATLHPDGMITAVMSGSVWQSAFTFDEMRTMGWEHAHIEWDPAPFLATDMEQPARHPVVDGVQATLI